MREDGIGPTGRSEPPVVGVIVAPGKGLPPGLDGTADVADLRLVRDRDELREVAADVDVLLVYDFRTTLLESDFARLTGLRWIHAASAGVDAVMTDDVAASDLTVTNAQGIFDRGIAEWVLGMMLVFAKDLLTTLELQRRHEWRHRNSWLLEDRRLLVVGAGSIGREIARLAAAVGMHVDGVARSERPDDPDFGRVAPSEELLDLLPGADYVVVATPLTEQTRGMIGAEELKTMPEQAVLMNIGRGPVVDEAALVEALRSGAIAGAALDVFEEEPLPHDHPLWDFENVIVSPHMSGDYEGWVEALGYQFTENFERWANGEPLMNVVHGGEHP